MNTKPSDSKASVQKLRVGRENLARLSGTSLEQVVGGAPTKTSRCTTRDGCTEDILCLLTVGCTIA